MTFFIKRLLKKILCEHANLDIVIYNVSEMYIDWNNHWLKVTFNITKFNKSVFFDLFLISKEDDLIEIDTKLNLKDSFDFVIFYDNEIDTFFRIAELLVSNVNKLDRTLKQMIPWNKIDIWKEWKELNKQNLLELIKDKSKMKDEIINDTKNQK